MPRKKGKRGAGYVRTTVTVTETLSMLMRTQRQINWSQVFREAVRKKLRELAKK